MGLEVIYDPEKLAKARKERTFQEEFPESVPCTDCNQKSRNIMIIDDPRGELVHVSPVRRNGIPIHPHDSCAFSMYMCTKCGHVDTVWNQG